MADVKLGLNIKIKNNQYYQSQTFMKGQTEQSGQISPQQVELKNQSKDELLSSLVSSSSQRQPASTPKASLKAATFGMMAAALGTGIFNLPLRITEVGIAFFGIYVLVAGLFSYLGCRLLQEMIVTKGFNSYGDLCQTAFGAPFKRFLQFCIILFPWGIAVCFQVIMPKFIIQLLVDVFNADFYKNEDEQIYNKRGEMARVVINIVIIITAFILIQLKDIRPIQRLGVVGVCSVTYNAITLFITLIRGFDHVGTPNIHYDGLFSLDWSVMQWAVFQNDAFSIHVQAIATILFCYINHQLVFPTCKNLQNPTNNRLKAVFLRSNLSEFILYIIIGLSGYTLLIQHEKVLPIGPMVLTTITTAPMKIGKALMVATLYLAVPLNLFPARTILQQALELETSTKNRLILSVTLAVSSCAVAIFFVSVNSYFGLLGGTTGVLIGGGIPAMCYWKLIIKQQPAKKTIKNYLKLGFIAVVTVLAFIGAILSVFDTV